jgi:hypothetical protein
MALVSRILSMPVTGSHQLLLFAIREKRLIQFVYSGRLRVAEPHDYGMQNGVTRLFVFQLGGESSSGRLPDWRLLDAEKICDLELLEAGFAGSREESGRRHTWDELFARVS